jgi:hypothetical protein
MDLDAAAMDVDVDAAVPRIIGDDGVLGVIYHDCADRVDIPERARRLRAAMLRLQATTSFDQVLPIYRELHLDEVVADNGTDFQYLASPILMALDRVNQRWDHELHRVSYARVFDNVDEEMPLYRQLVTHVTMAILVLEQGDVSLLRFMQERQLDLIYARDLGLHAVMSDSPDMLSYLDEHKLLDRQRYRRPRVSVCANTAIHHGRNRSLKWMLQHGRASLVECANDVDMYTAAGALERFKMLLDMGMAPPRVLRFQMTTAVVQEMLDRGTPVSHWEDDDCTAHANAATHLLLLRNGWEPYGESTRRILLHKEEDKECRRYALAQGVLYPTLNDMRMLADYRRWDTMRDVLQHPDAFDVTRDNYGLWRFIDYLSPPPDIRALIRSPTLVRLRRVGSRGFELV